MEIEMTTQLFITTSNINFIKMYLAVLGMKHADERVRCGIFSSFTLYKERTTQGGRNVHILCLSRNTELFKCTNIWNPIEVLSDLLALEMYCVTFIMNVKSLPTGVPIVSLGV
jgi:hypothetical protein